LAQGDFLCACPVIVPLDTLRKPEKSKHGPPKAVQEIDASVREFNVVILTQDCDIPKPSTRHILVCEYKRLADVQKDSAFFRDNDNLENVRRGYIHRQHLLNKCLRDGLKEKYKTDDLLVLNFNKIYSVPKELAIRHAAYCGDRPRLKSPYKERMSQAFAKYFMRIAVDDGKDIPAFVERDEED